MSQSPGTALAALKTVPKVFEIRSANAASLRNVTTKDLEGAKTKILALSSEYNKV